MEDLFKETPYGRVALKKLKAKSPNFRIYCCGWLGDKSDVMEVIGAEFREATRGPRKGQLCIPLPNTKRVVYVTAAEIRRADKRGAKNG